MKSERGRLQDKVALVTGGGAGIGRAIALAFAVEGADVAVCDVDIETAEGVENEVRAQGRKAVSARADVSNYDDVSQMVKTIVEKFGKIDILVNNAGIIPSYPAEEITPDQWNRVLGICLNGVFFCSQLVGREMIKRKSGRIINISSMAGMGGTPFQADYVAAKHGVVGLTKALAVEWARYNINVNCICPGTTETPTVMKKFSPEWMTARVKRVPLGRLAKPEDLTKVAIFLASSESDYITGYPICVDGGSWALFSGATPPEREL